MGRAQTNSGSAELARRLWLFVDATEEFAVFVLDETGQVVAWNAGAQLLTGYSADELRGRHHSCLYPAEAVADQSPARDLRTAEGAGPAHLRGNRLRKDGSVLDARIVIAALRDERGTLLGFGGTLSDVATQPHRPVAAHDSAIAARSTTLAEHAVGRSIHDFNNLLTVILGSAEALAQRLDAQPELRTYCDTIADAAVRGAEFTRALYPVRDP
jgi:PAS domain S-box-containing protein